MTAPSLINNSDHIINYSRQGESTIIVLGSCSFSLKDNHAILFTYSPDYTIAILWSWSSSFEENQSVWHIYLMLKWKRVSEWVIVI